MKDENKHPWGPNKGAPGAQQRGPKGPRMVKIDQNLDFFSILLPSNSLWQQIFIVYTDLIQGSSNQSPGESYGQWYPCPA